MIPLSILKIAPLVAAMRIVVTVLPGGDIERVAFTETEDGVQAIVERAIARTDVTTRRRQFLRRARYTWRIDEERRSVLLAPPGQPTGVQRRAYSVAGWLDISQRATDPPRPFEVFRFYAPSRVAADELRDRLRRALRP
ncbi:hypothetical protein EON82_09990 [bacterium]|nr:MAG: hypothetical protein EON82_09990 [bacterium]